MFDYAYIKDQWEHLPKRRVRYSHDETGWVAMLDEPYACIANLPIDPNLFMLDIVELGLSGPDNLRQIVALAQRYYVQRFIVRYLGVDIVPDREQALTIYRQIDRACHDHDCHSEGLLPGLATVHAPEGVDVPAFLEALEIPHLHKKTP